MTGQFLVPQYVKNLNALAESHDLSTRVYVEPYKDKPEQPILFAEWKGKKTDFFSMGLLAQYLQLPIQYMPNIRDICGIQM